MSPGEPLTRPPAPRSFLLGWMSTVGGLLLPTIGLICLYLVSLLRMSLEMWVFFGLLVAAATTAVFSGYLLTHRALLSPLLGYLEDCEHDPETRDRLPEAFRAASHLPGHGAAGGFFAFSAGGVVIALGMGLRFEQFGSFSGVVVTIAAATGGFVCILFGFFLVKRFVHPLRAFMAERIADADERAALSFRVPMARKIFLSMTGMAFSTAVYAMLLAHVHASEALERHIAARQGAFLEHVLEGRGVSPALPAATVADARALGVADAVYWLEPGSGAIDNAAGRLIESEIALARASDHGDSLVLQSPHVFSWRRDPLTGSTLVASSEWSSLARGGLGAFWWIFSGLGFFAAALAFAISRLLAADTGVALASLQLAADRVAEGDLSELAVLENDDELGDLARGFGRMAVTLRAAVSQVVRAADRIDAAAGEISFASNSVAEGSATQGTGLAEAAGSVERVTDRMSAISGSAAELSELMEQSSASILEMSAAGDELNDTAGALSLRVEEVSSSIGQSVRSLAEVRTQTGGLQEAAEETSSSMVEMAASMRMVDQSAGRASELSQGVVRAAVEGQEKVRETIVGMDSIRQTTELAREVIGRLGGRAQEIGAIVDVIDDVGDETNLLALNAAIIAAQSGESGRAFAVVAEEIRELADRVLLSTKEIDGLVRAVQEEATAAVGAIQEGVVSVAHGVDRSREAGASLEEITRASRDSGALIEEIVASVREQTRAASMVVERMEMVREGVEHILAASEEQSRGHEIVLRSAEVMGDVTRQVKTTTEEQARGSARIREGIEGVRSAMDDIYGALRSQSTACEEVARFLDEVSGGTRSNEAAASRMAGATGALKLQADELRRHVARFRL